MPTEPVPLSQKRPIGRHGNSTANAETRSTQAAKQAVEMSATVDGRPKRFSVKLETDADVQWVMQVSMQF